MFTSKVNKTQIERLRSIDEEKVSISHHLFGEMLSRKAGQAIFYVGVIRLGGKDDLDNYRNRKE